MRSINFFAFGLSAIVSQVAAHYTFPSLVVGGVTTPPWVNVRMTNNYNTQAPVTDVTSLDLRCYDTQTNATAETISIAAGAQLGIMSDGTIYHPGVVNVYMAKAPGDVSTWAGDGAVWFKVYQISAVTNGGTSISWPAQNLPGVTFTLPSQLPTGQYLVRMEAIALHVAETYGGAQFYISCGQINVTGGGSGTPGPLVSIPGVYTGYEPGILININYPIPANYTQPGPPVWSGTGNSGSSSITSAAPPPTSPVSSPPVSSPTTSASGPTQTQWGQCGGNGYTGPTTCASPYKCVAVSPPYYSQCQ